MLQETPVLDIDKVEFYTDKSVLKSDEEKTSEDKRLERVRYSLSVDQLDNAVDWLAKYDLKATIIISEKKLGVLRQARKELEWDKKQNRVAAFGLKVMEWQS